MSVIGLGLDHRLRELRRNGAVTYNGWCAAGLTRVDTVAANLSPGAFQRAFEEAMESATRIVFDLTDLDLEIARQSGTRGFTSRNYTNAELARILQNPEWLAKTSFVFDGQSVNLENWRIVFESP